MPSDRAVPGQSAATPPDPGHTVHWLPLPEAATATGVSIRTMRRRVADNVVRYRREKRVTYVEVAADTSDPGDITDTHTDNLGAVSAATEDTAHVAGDTVSVAAMTAAVTAAVTARADQEARLLTELLAAREAAAMWQERARGLERDVVRLEERLALPPPQVEPNDGLSDPEPAVVKQASRPWWKFWNKT